MILNISIHAEKAFNKTLYPLTINILISYKHGVVFQFYIRAVIEIM